MSKRSITHLVPRFAPQIDGLGDYARCLARELREHHDLESRFMVGDPTWAGPSQAEGFPVEVVRARASQPLADSLARSDAVLVHYVGYGYAKRGLPFWIDGGLRAWKRKGSATRQYFVMFHELWASGPPWRSEFYLGWIQRRLEAAIHRGGAASVTSTKCMAILLEELQPGKTTQLPVPSAFPVLDRLGDATRSFGGRLEVLIFGQAEPRLQAVRTHSRLLKALEKSGRLSRVIVAGKGARGGPDATPDVRELMGLVPAERVEVAGQLDAEDVVAVFRRAHLFLSQYPAPYLCKSSSLMIALGNGCPAVLAEGEGAAPLEPMRHFFVCDGSESDLRRLMAQLDRGELEQIARAAFEWYRSTADWSVVGAGFRRLLEQPGTPRPAETLAQRASV